MNNFEIQNVGYRNHHNNTHATLYSKLRNAIKDDKSANDSDKYNSLMCACVRLLALCD